MTYQVFASTVTELAFPEGYIARILEIGEKLVAKKRDVFLEELRVLSKKYLNELTDFSQFLQEADREIRGGERVVRKTKEENEQRSDKEKAEHLFDF